MVWDERVQDPGQDNCAGRNRRGSRGRVWEGDEAHRLAEGLTVSVFGGL